MEIKIPLPPIEEQKKIVEELDRYQRIIDGARMVIDNWKPEIEIDPEWELKDFHSVCTLEYGKGLPKKDRNGGEYPVMGSNGVCGYHDEYLVEGPSIIVGRKGSAGKVVWEQKNCYPIDTTYYVKPQIDAIELKFLYFILKSLDFASLKNGSSIPGLNRNDVYSTFKIPLPSLKVQKEIIKKIEEQEELIEKNKEIIDFFEKKSADVISKIFNE